MTRRQRLILAGALAGVAAMVLILLLVPQMSTPPGRPEAPAVAPPVEAGTTAHITATLFYASSDGLALVPMRREVPFAEGVMAQGRQILMAQFGPAPSPLISVIPKGTSLRAFYVTDRGDAFVDLSREISSAHPGGSVTELLTVNAIVNAVAANLPAVQRVQLLVDGKEVDTIAGHVDVRRPLSRDPTLVRGEPAR